MKYTECFVQNIMGRYSSYTVKFKICAAKYAKENTILESSRKIEVDRKNISEWVQQNDAGQFRDCAQSAKRLRGGGRKVKNTQVDNDVFEWFSERSARGIRVTGKQLLVEAQRRYIAS